MIYAEVPDVVKDRLRKLDKDGDILTLMANRDELAMAAMQGILASKIGTLLQAEDVARIAYEHAEEMLKARLK